MIINLTFACAHCGRQRTIPWETQQRGGIDLLCPHHKGFERYSSGRLFLRWQPDPTAALMPRERVIGVTEEEIEL